MRTEPREIILFGIKVKHNQISFVFVYYTRRARFVKGVRVRAAAGAERRLQVRSEGTVPQVARSGGSHKRWVISGFCSCLQPSPK